MNTFNSYYNKLSKGVAYADNRLYKAEASTLVEDEDFCVGFKNDTMYKDQYLVRIKTLYKGTSSTFTRVVIADDEEDAKQQVIKFINSRPDLFRFSWKSDGIEVTKINHETTQN